MTQTPYERGSSGRSVSERDKLLKRWVKQPPANPNMQYMRDAERIAAFEQIGNQTDVLDVASEINVTRGINAETVSRLDFSPIASDYAQQQLNEAVAHYAVTDPEWPQLPFNDSEFDAAVSIGPFDWKFLDADRLFRELHRVIRDNGLFVFSVPTPRSPYSTADSYRFRYYTSDEVHRFIPLDWRLLDYDLLFQYPDPIHTAINKLPNEAQLPFVDLAWMLSERITDRNLWDAASYLVLGIEPLDYESHLEKALECLFRPIEKDGFWDTEEEKIIRALEYSITDKGFVWRPDDSVEWRYAPFALMGVMRWRTSALGSDQYDGKIRSQLRYFTNCIEDKSTLNRMPSYGIGPLIVGFTLAAESFDESRYAATANRLYEYSRQRFDFTHAEDSLLLFGWSHLYKYSDNDELRDDIANALWTVNERITPAGLFRFENSTTLRHQNQMYALWGLCAAIEVTGTAGYLDSAEQVLDYTIEHRMRDDGAFIWEDVSRRRRLKRAVLKRMLPFNDPSPDSEEKWPALKRIGGRPPHWDFLYECHQTFFVNAVLSYYAAGGAKNYDRELREAMSWIYGDNALGRNLVEYSGIGVPMRQMTVDTRIDVADQMYKGAYEVGSYIMALTDLVTER